MNRKGVLRLLALGAGLLALAAPLRAGEAKWLSTPDGRHILQLQAGWQAGAAVPGLSPKGVPHAYSLMPPSRAYVLDVASEFTQLKNYVSTEDYFDKARARAGNPPAARVQLPDNSLYEYFRAPVEVKGSKQWRVQGVLYKYVQRYYVTFSSNRGYPADKDWKEALRLLATLEFQELTVGGWNADFTRKFNAAGLGKTPPAAGGPLLGGASSGDGTAVSLENVAIFGCKNFLGNLYLFNEEHTAHCWIAPLKDYTTLMRQLPPRDWKDGPAAFPDCPEAMRQERACDLEKLRNF